MTNEMQDLKTAIRNRAMDEGFQDVRFAAAIADRQTGDRLASFIRHHRHGEMDWMASTEQRRTSPQALWPDARTVIMLAMNYGPDSDPMLALNHHRHGVISCYAGGRDYHDTIKKALKRVARWLHRDTGAEVKVFVDTAPVLEKPMAAKSGLGWQGKHTNLVSKSYGSWLFLGSIFTTLDIAPDDAEINHCGSCDKCLKICPTNAFPAPYQLDARRCISYLTIEYDGHIPVELRRPMGNRIFGCDDCLAVCPWNKFAQKAHDIRFQMRPELDLPLLADLLRLDDAAFRKRFAGSPVKRTGRDRFLRNVLIAAGNSGAPELAGEIEPLLTDPSALVRAMAVWALSCILCKKPFEALRGQAMQHENDAAVTAEWKRPYPS